MRKGTLVVSRAVNNHPYYKKRFEALGFPDVTVTALEKDALSSLIRKLKPKNIVMGKILSMLYAFFNGEIA